METDYLVPAKDKRGNIILDTTLHQTASFQIDEMNGDWGDAGRVIYLHVMGRAQSNNTNLPLMGVDLTGRDVRFQGIDADDKIKVIETTTKIIDARNGILEMTLPRQIYQAVGRYEHAEFEIYEVDGDTKISTVPVAFEVYDHQVIASVGASENYIDSIEKLKKDIQIRFDDLRDRVIEQATDASATLAKLQTDFNLLKQKLDLWDEKIDNKGVGFLDGNNIWAGFNEFQEVIKGFITGTAIGFYGVNQEQQDLDKATDMIAMKPGTTKQDYYSGNKLLHNPFASDFAFVITNKISSGTAYQFAILMNASGGEIKVRNINSIGSTPNFCNWFSLTKWSDWQSLEPYLNSNWVATYADQSKPQFKYENGSVRLRGKISPKGTIAKPATTFDKIEMTKDLPFTAKSVQYLPQIWSGVHPYTLRLEDSKLMAERIFNDAHELTELKNTWMFILSGTFGLVD